jgi:hypothetical protein
MSRHFKPHFLLLLLPLFLIFCSVYTTIGTTTSSSLFISNYDTTEWRKESIKEGTKEGMKEAQKEEVLKMEKKEKMEKATSPQQLTSDSASEQQQRSTQNIIRLCNDSNDNKVILKGLLYGCIVMTETGKNWNNGLDYVYWTFSFEVNQNMAVLNVKDCE